MKRQGTLRYRRLHGRDIEAPRGSYGRAFEIGFHLDPLVLAWSRSALGDVALGNIFPNHLDFISKSKFASPLSPPSAPPASLPLPLPSPHVDGMVNASRHPTAAGISPLTHIPYPYPPNSLMPDLVESTHRTSSSSSSSSPTPTGSEKIV